MDDETFTAAVHAIAFGGEGQLEKPKYYALSNDEIAVYLARPRVASPGVIVLHRNGTWRYDRDLPANDPLK